MLQARQLTKHFTDKKRGTVRAVDGVDLECKAGEIFGLLGLNGAGKTTTLRLLATILRADSGSVMIDGVDAQVHPEKVRSKIGFLTGSTGLYLRLTPREILAYFGQLAGLDNATIARRSDDLIARLGMKEFADSRVDKLSSGQKQRTSIARTLIHDPPLLILDEPTIGLDVVTSRAIVEFIREARTRGKCVLLSTHIMHEAAKLCDRIAILHAGRVRRVGTLADFRTQYGHDDLDDIFVAAIEGNGGMAQ
ncbi:MAG: ATP-binding cassette domain-containing protein [candidate division Zixibacteria bacterium]|nr:ATP-binding cassette domain-containing protein [candidate division Zixibacteria bacterium]